MNTRSLFLAIVLTLFNFNPDGFLLAQFIEAEPELPTVEISAPEKVKNGYMVVVTAKLDKSNLPPNLLSTNYQWTVLVNGTPSEGFLVWPDNTKILFGASEEDSITTVILNVNCLFGKREKARIGESDKEVDVLTYVSMKSAPLASTAIIVEGNKPNPPAPPNPGPNPPVPPSPPGPGPIPGPVNPNLPVGRFDLANFAYQTISNQASLTPQQKLALATEYSSTLAGIASQIGALPNYKDVATILKDTTNRNQESRMKLGINDVQTAEFNRIFGDKIYDLYATKKTLRTAQDIADAWREMSTGFTAYINFNPVRLRRSSLQ